MNHIQRAGAASRMWAAGMGVTLGSLLLCAGCSGSHSTAVSVAASTTLTSDANAVGSAAEAGVSDRVSAAAAKMRSDVLALEASGGLSSARAAAVLAQLQRVVSDAALVPTASSQAPAGGGSTPAPTGAVPTPAAPGSGHGRKSGGPPPGHDKPHP
jgi:hypothetical protein